jgi:hypothetical protein
MGSTSNLISIPPALLSALFRMCWMSEEWDKLAGNLELSIAKLSSIGYSPAVATPEGLAAMTARDSDLELRSSHRQRATRSGHVFTGGKADDDHVIARSARSLAALILSAWRALLPDQFLNANLLHRVRRASGLTLLAECAKRTSEYHQPTWLASKKFPR